MSTKQELHNQIVEKAMTDEAFKTALQTNPKAALKEAFNVDLPEDVIIEVVEETSKKHYITLPTCPEEEVESPAIW